MIELLRPKKVFQAGGPARSMAEAHQPRLWYRHSEQEKKIKHMWPDREVLAGLRLLVPRNWPMTS